MGLISGSETDNNLFSGADAAPIDRVALYQGFTGPVGTPTATKGFGFPSQPDLAIIALGINDASQSVARGTYRDGLDRLIWSLRYGKSDACSIAILGVWGPDGTIGTSTTVTNQDQTANSWTAYRDLRAAMIEVAQAEECAYIDVHGAFGRFPVTNGWIDNATDVHPTVAGHLKIANLLNALV
jgi:lysophospholipase L1-like esterase